MQAFGVHDHEAISHELADVGLFAGGGGLESKIEKNFCRSFVGLGVSKPEPAPMGGQASPIDMLGPPDQQAYSFEDSGFCA